MFKEICKDAITKNKPLWSVTFVLLIMFTSGALAFCQTMPKSHTQDWSGHQKKVWETVKACTQASHQRNLEKYLSFWHQDFLGWHNGDSTPTNYQQREKGLQYYFSYTKSLEYELEPMAIQIIADGKAAIVHYKLRNDLQVTTTGKNESGTAYWTDYLVNEGGRWLLISDHGGNVEEDNKSLEKLGWLVGKWQRLDTKPNQTASEIWTKESSRKFSGTGLTLQGKDTVFVETLRLTFNNDKLYYIAEVSHNKEPIYFEVTQITDRGFVCENPQHDFPKKIDYELDENRLTVVISGDGKSISFRFVKIIEPE
jgi:ketosteroid isomerase-like protein